MRVAYSKILSSNTKWQQFKPQVEACLQTILSSPVIHIDETTVNLTNGQERGYVWLFATARTVYYHLSKTRESSFLQQWLKDYTGTIVTDFYGGYEACPPDTRNALFT